ncbi:hypothetical protein [Haloferula sp. A504]|uniref:hypothetical protein n=1 Tax=Haloferula sp. A504 TaxID=3373601 RepID=UPI0031C94123|nr:hypothetical protein [Verrucomicrobiaceae bacterium E54]
MKQLLTPTIALGLAGAASAAVVFTEDFEGYGNADDNTVATYDQYPPTPTGWVAANTGFNASQSGLNLVGTNTVYSFRYTNSGLTTTDGQIGNLAAGTYTISFDVLFDNGNASPFSVYLGTFATADDADRRDAASGATSDFSALLARVDGEYNAGTPAWEFSSGGTDNDSQAFSNSTATSTTVTFTYISDGTETTAGQDVALRLDGATTTGNIDNVSVDFVAIPEPSAALLGGIGCLMLLRRRRR